MIKQVEDKTEKEIISKKILADLPEWFGIEEARKHYIDQSKSMPFLAFYIEKIPVGFISLKETSKDCAEIFVIGILKEYQKMGIGRALYLEFEKMAKELNYSYLQVKTVKFGEYKEYDISNKHYQAMGFKQMECFPEMWDPQNPCQIYIKYIG